MTHPGLLNTENACFIFQATLAMPEVLIPQLDDCPTFKGIATQNVVCGPAAQHHVQDGQKQGISGPTQTYGTGV